MQPEIEVKFLDVNHDDIRRRLRSIDAKLEYPMRLMRRAILDYPDARLQNTGNAWEWVRVRDESDKITVTFKRIMRANTREVYESEVQVSSYEDAITLLCAIGLEVKSEQESKREAWTLDGAEVVLDEWPWLPPYIEIEAPKQEIIQSIVDGLDLDMSAARYDNIDAVYRKKFTGMKETETISEIKQLTFAGQMPSWLEERKS